MDELIHRHSGRLTNIAKNECVEKVLDKLEEEACFNTPLDRAGKNARSHDDPELLYLIVEHFYDLYRKYVTVANSTDVAPAAAHWNVYQRLVNATKTSPIGMLQVIVLFTGIRAHTRYDLAEAICFAHNSYQRQHSRAPDVEHFRSVLFGKHSDEVFRKASVDFFETFLRSNRGRTAFGNTLKAASLLWFPVIQTLRELAWKDARRSILSGTSISRLEGSEIHGSAF